MGRTRCGSGHPAREKSDPPTRHNTVTYFHYMPTRWGKRKGTEKNAASDVEGIVDHRSNIGGECHRFTGSSPALTSGRGSGNVTLESRAHRRKLQRQGEDIVSDWLRTSLPHVAKAPEWPSPKLLTFAAALIALPSGRDLRGVKTGLDTYLPQPRTSPQQKPWGEQLVTTIIGIGQVA